MKLRPHLLAIGALAVVLHATSAHAAPIYKVTMTDLLPGLESEYFTPASINNAGQIVGWSSFNAFLYSGGVFTDLGKGPDGVGAQAYDINDSGQVVGLVGLSVTNEAFLYSNGTMVDIGSQLGGYHSTAAALNNAGQVVGTYTKKLIDDPDAPVFGEKAFLYSAGTMTDLGTLGGTFSSALDINTQGQVVGWSQVAGDAAMHAFVYANGSMTDLGIVGSAQSPLRINDAGQIAGSAILPGNLYEHAFIHDNGVVTDLGTLGGPRSGVNGINAAGQAVGWTDVPNPYNHNQPMKRPFLYSDGEMLDLNTLLVPGDNWSVRAAYDVNDSGDIAAFGCIDWICRAIVLEAIGQSVPEPASLALACMALTAAGLSRRQRRRAAL